MELVEDRFHDGLEVVLYMLNTCIRAFLAAYTFESSHCVSVVSSGFVASH